MCYLDFCLKRKTLFLKVNNQSLKLPSFNYDMEFSSVQKFFHRTFSPSRNNLKRNLDFSPHIGVVTPSPSPLPLPVGVHEHIHFDWPRGEHCCQNSPPEYHFYKVILYPADHDETSRDPGSGSDVTNEELSQPDGGELAKATRHARAPALRTIRAQERVLFFSS